MAPVIPPASVAPDAAASVNSAVSTMSCVLSVTTLEVTHAIPLSRITSPLWVHVSTKKAAGNYPLFGSDRQRLYLCRFGLVIS